MRTENQMERRRRVSKEEGQIARIKAILGASEEIIRDGTRIGDRIAITTAKITAYDHIKQILQYPTEKKKKDQELEKCRKCKYGECYNDEWCRCNYPKISGCRVRIKDGCEVESYGLMPYKEKGAPENG